MTRSLLWGWKRWLEFLAEPTPWQVYLDTYAKTFKEVIR